MPVLFVGHGSPMNAIEDNAWSGGFRELGALLPRPKAILVISAHWFVPGTFLTANAHPRTIHDFGGFPRQLYEIQYPAPGDAGLARRTAGLIGEGRAELREDWGLDHGAWSVLLHMYPAADVPIVQISINEHLSPEAHLALGRALAPLRAEGVLLLGSGNIVHNLRHAMMSYSTGDLATPHWASGFDAEVARALTRGDADYLAGAPRSENGRLAHPTLDHYLPLLYIAGAAGEDAAVQFPITGFDLGSLSMRAALLG